MGGSAGVKGGGLAGGGDCELVFVFVSKRVFALGVVCCGGCWLAEELARVDQSW